MIMDIIAGVARWEVLWVAVTQLPQFVGMSDERW